MAMHFNENLDDNGEMHDINVTPFIDVMLVLLIIFMVAAPLATVDVKVNLPGFFQPAAAAPGKTDLPVGEGGQNHVSSVMTPSPKRA
ncbi:biopolymer transport protein ExbD/TolR [Klebsiella grimontii]|uniref:Biopolymer transport protein ExbD/TolR n=1 Tax=Klebsiella grimontii TaxID=2058152 RepID=A0A7H4NWL1_9ENTR|nr:biopolymer transport protein ExbD/TolR [Klebsiella grimontii]